MEDKSQTVYFLVLLFALVSAFPPMIMEESPIAFIKANLPWILALPCMSNWNYAVTLSGKSLRG